MVYMFKFNCTRSEAVQLLVTLTHDIKYKILQDYWLYIVEVASKWQPEKHYHHRDEANSRLRAECEEAYKRSPSNLFDMTQNRIWMVLPYGDGSQIMGIHITWKDAKNYTFFVSTEYEKTWKVHFAKMLFKIAYDFTKIVRPVKVNDQELKVGEWLAALLYDLSGDPAGMLATLDSAEDRK